MNNVMVSARVKDDKENGNRENAGLKN